MSQKIEDCTAILSDDGETITFNAQVPDGVEAVPVFVDADETPVEDLKAFFDRHGEPR